MSSRSLHPTVLDVGVQRLARVYAKAFLGAAETKGTIAEWMEELDWLAELLGEHPDLERLLSSLLIPAEEKTGILQRVLQGQVSEDFMHFLYVLARHARLDLLRSIRSEALKLYNEMRGLVDVQVTTAAPLEEAMRDELAESLNRLLEGEPVFHFHADPALLGGILVRVGDRVYDGSVASRLRRARHEMVHRVVDQITSNRETFLQEV